MKRKRLFAILLCFVMVFMLTACGNTSENNGSTESAQQELSSQTDTVYSQTPASSEETEPRTDTGTPADTEEPASGSNILVVYFSRTGEQYRVGVIDKGNTAIVAEMIIEATGADSFEILPQEDYYPYTYDELTDVAKQEQNENARPAYAGEVPDLSQYDTVFIGAPVWWGDWPMICYTFFESNAEALSGKTLIPFSTHEGSGLSGFDRKLASAIPSSIVGEGLAIQGNDAQNNQDSVKDKVNDWLAKLGF
jgi:flavodoxin